MRVGESRRFALELKTDSPLAMAMVALRFDPKVVKIQAVAVDGGATAPAFTQSTDASGVCLISISGLNAATSKSSILLYVDVQGIGIGDAGLLLDKDSMHLVGTDARNVSVEVTAARAIVKQ